MFSLILLITRKDKIIVIANKLFKYLSFNFNKRKKYFVSNVLSFSIFVCIKVNKSFNTRMDWHYELSLETYLNTHFLFSTIYNRGILMIPCLIFLCQVGLHFCECWVIFLYSSDFFICFIFPCLPRVEEFISDCVTICMIIIYV